MALIRDLNLSDPDEAYAAIVAAHSDLSDEESVALNARLVLLLINHIGDSAVLHEALAAARRTLGKSS